MQVIPANETDRNRRRLANLMLDRITDPQLEVFGLTTWVHPDTGMTFTAHVGWDADGDWCSVPVLGIDFDEEDIPA